MAWKWKADGGTLAILHRKGVEKAWERRGFGIKQSLLSCQVEFNGTQYPVNALKTSSTLGLCVEHPTLILYLMTWWKSRLLLIQRKVRWKDTEVAGWTKEVEEPLHSVCNIHLAKRNHLQSLLSQWEGQEVRGALSERGRDMLHDVRSERYETI